MLRRQMNIHISFCRYVMYCFISKHRRREGCVLMRCFRLCFTLTTQREISTFGRGEINKREDFFSIVEFYIYAKGAGRHTESYSMCRDTHIMKRRRDIDMNMFTDVGLDSHTDDKRGIYKNIDLRVVVDTGYMFVCIHVQKEVLSMPGEELTVKRNKCTSLSSSGYSNKKKQQFLTFPHPSSE